MMHSIHESSGGTWGPDGTLLSYGDPVAELRAIRTGAGLAERADKAIITVEGPDALEFLQNLLSNDINLVSADRAVYTLGLDAGGHILFDSIVTGDGADRFMLLVSSACSENAWNFLVERHFSENLEIGSGKGFGCLGIYGPKSADVAEDAFALKLNPVPYSVLRAEFEGSELAMVSVPDTGEEGFEVILPVDVMPTAWKKAAAACRPVGAAALAAAALEAGIPRYGSEFDENILAAEAGLWRAISATKGCYTGQEAIARMRARGRTARNLARLIVLEGDEPLPSGTRLEDDEGLEAGFCVSSIFSPTAGRPLVFAYLSPSHLKASTRLRVSGGGVPVEVVEEFLNRR